MKILRTTAVIFFVFSLITVARGDIVHLKSGGRLEGEVEIRGDTLIVRNKYGSTEVPVNTVRMVEESTTVLEKYRELSAEVGDENIDGQRRLADFCRENSMPEKEKYHLLQVLRLRPDDVPARSRLGQVQIGGRWMTKSDEMYARGLTRFRGEWVSPQDKQEMLSEERKRRRELAAARKAQRDRRLAEIRARSLAQARRERAQRRASEGALGISYVDPSFYNPYDRSNYYDYYRVYYPSYRRVYYPYNETYWEWYKSLPGRRVIIEYGGGNTTVIIRR
jgi:hypothetical protein